MSMSDVAEAFEAGAWEFTPEVVAEFDKHVRQSVPFYDVIQDTVAELADWLAPARSLVVDIGCSTGETFARLCERHPERAWELVGYDESQQMLDAAREKVPGMKGRLSDVTRGLSHRGASLTMALFMLQFLPTRAERVAVLRDALDRTDYGGAIIVAEKVRAVDARWFEIGQELSWDYKANQGIQSEAIRAKARALRGVLRPLTVDENLELMREAGWQGADVLFRWHQWVLLGGFAS